MPIFVSQVDFANIPLKGTAIEAELELPTDPIPGRVAVLAELKNAYQIIYTLHFYNGVEWKQIA